MNFLTRTRHGFAVLLLLATFPVLAATLTVTNTNDSGPGSLREALTNAASGDRIEFSIGSGPQTIKPQTSLPLVVVPIVIDARTQPGYDGKPIIELDGSFPWPNLIYGFDLRHADVYGLVVNNFMTAISLQTGGVYNCYIGTDLSGTVAKPNSSSGISVSGDPVTPTVIGGPGTNGNLIVGGNQKLAVGTNVSIQGNVFGTNVTQTAPLGPGGLAIAISGNNVTVGGDVPNVIVNSQFGVLIEYGGTNTRIEGNYIGTTPAGMTAYMERGLQLYVTTDTLVQGNVIKAMVGIQVPGNEMGLGNKFLGNSIDADLIGIDLELPRPFPYFAPTPNDAGDADIGPNNYLNYPVISSSTSYNSQTTITGTLESVPNTTQHVELFASAACASLGSGPGQEFLDAFEITTDGSGAASFTRIVDALPHGTIVTATATTDSDGTSEFSPCVVTEGPGTFSFKAPSYGNNEGAATVVTVNRNDGGVGEVTVTYAVTGGTASDADFTGANGTLTFAAGETSKSFTVQSTPDLTYEADETVVIMLTEATAGASIGSPSVTTLTIDDDDPPPFVSLRSIAVHEGDSGTTIAQVPITLSQPTGVAYSLPYTIGTGHGASSDDFAIESGSVTFQPGETEKSIPVTIYGDVRFEPNEGVDVTVLGATPSAKTILVILNDDPPPTVSVRNTRAIEGNGSGTLMIELASDVPVEGEVTVSFHEGSAHLLTDFQATSQSLLFNNETSKSFIVTILGDEEPEGDEQFTIELHTSSPGITAGPIATFTIVNDDLRVSAAEQWIPSGGSGTFTVQLGTSLEDVTVTLTADTPDISVPATLVIPAGQSSAEFTVSALAAGANAGITVGMPSDRGSATRIVHALTYATATLRFSPARLSLIEGETTEVSVSLDPPALTATPIGLNPTGRVDVPSSLTIPAGGSATFAVTARRSGAFAIEAQLPPVNGNEMQSLFGDVIVPPSAIEISTVTPSAGASAGGTHVRVNGSHFNGSCWIFFGSTAATNVIVRDSEAITGVAPAHAAGASDVTVRCTGGAFTADRAFTYRDENDPAPLITEVDPTAAAPGELVTIHGLNFRPNDRVTFDSTSAEIVDASPESHVVTVPEMPAGDVSVFVQDSFNRISTSGPLFSVLEALPPRITAVSPSAVPAGGELELTGEGFRAGNTFEIGGHPATIVSIEYRRAIVRVSFEVAPGSYPVQVRGGATTPLENGPPVEIIDGGMIVIAADPRCTTTGGGVYAIIRGNGFPSGPMVAFAGVPSEDVSRVNETTLRVKVPPGDAGIARISVTDGTGHTATLTNGFTYASPFDPRGCSGRTRMVRH